MRTLAGPVRELTAVAVSPDGAEVAACGLGPLHVWRGDRRTDSADDGVSAVAYTPDGRWLIYKVFNYGGSRSGLYALDRRDGGPAVRLPGGYLLATAAGRLLVRDDRTRTVRVVRTDGSPPFLPPVWEQPQGSGVVASAAFLPDGRAVTLAHAVGGVVVAVRDADTGAVLATLPAPAFGALLPSPAGDRLVSVGGTRVAAWRTDDWAAAPLTATLGRRTLRGAVWHPAGGFLLGVGVDGTVRRVDAGSWRVTAEYTFPAGKARAVAVAPDGLTAAAATSRGRVVLFDLD